MESLLYFYIPNFFDLDANGGLSLSNIKSTIQEAFDIWNAVTPLFFHETTGEANFTIG